MMKNKTGLVIGKFAPLHNGHVNMINKAATMVDHLYVFLSHDDKWLNEKVSTELQHKLTLKNRLRWLKSVFHDLDHITVDFIDETDLPSYPNGWEEFINAIQNKAVKSGYWINNPTYVFSSEQEYDQGFKKFLPKTKHIIVDKDRRVVPISATNIRENVFKNWSHIPSVVRKDFVYKVCVIGTESCGKTTLVKYLAKNFNTSWVEEYGRTIVENELFRDESLLQYGDYRKIAYRHKELEEQAAKTANKIMFVDTDAVVTAFYQELYEGSVDPVVEAFARSRDYDLTIDLLDDVKWVADGMRSNDTKELRNHTRCLLDEMLLEFDVFKKGNNYHRIGGNYTERLEKAIDIIERNSKIKVS